MAASEVFENIGSRETGWILSWLKSPAGGEYEETLLLGFMVWSINKKNSIFPISYFESPSFIEHLPESLHESASF